MREKARKILLVEDRLSFSSLWEAELSSNGFEVDFARNERAAIKKLNEAENTYDAVVIDVNLVDGGGSREGGLEVARWIRSQGAKRLQQLPIVFAVVNPAEEHRQEFRALNERGGGGTVLVKPFASRALRLAIEELLAGKTPK